MGRLDWSRAEAERRLFWVKRGGTDKPDAAGSTSIAQPPSAATANASNISSGLYEKLIALLSGMASMKPKTNRK
jgi:hypothetical protein